MDNPFDDDRAERQFRSAVASDDLDAGLEFEMASIVKQGDCAATYAEDFIGKLAVASDSLIFDAGERFRRAWPKDFKVSEFKRRIRDARAVIDAAARREAAGDAAPWRSLLICSEKGAPLALLANAITALRSAPEWQGVLAFDEFAVRSNKLKAPPFMAGQAGWWTDDDDIRTADWLQHRGISVSTGVASEAAQSVARLYSYHPVRDWLSSLEWDGTARIDMWLSDYLGADENNYIRAVGAKWLISAVARVLQPGCQADHCLILEGEQGIRKSTALRTLADPWFTDDVEDLGSKDSAMQIHGVWVVELAELDAMRRSESSRIKAFLARRIDHFRPPYGRRTADFPRQCVFAGSTNQNAYLSDETGARRFWPVRCGDIDLSGLSSAREQLWAEAAARYANGEIWWFGSVAEAQAAMDEQSKRYEQDPWDEAVWDWVKDQRKRWDETEDYQAKASARVVEEYSVSSEDILESCLKCRPEQWTHVTKNRVNRILTVHGMKRFQKRLIGGDKKPLLGPDGRQERKWRYRMPEAMGTSQSLRLEPQAE